MSHFLARLVERARGTAARVEPLVTPRFGPTSIVEIASEVEAPATRRSLETQTAIEKKSTGRTIVRQEISSTRPEQVTAPEPETLLVPQKILVPDQPKPIVRRIGSEEVAALPRVNGATPKQPIPEQRATRPGSAPPATTRTLVAGGADPGRPSAQRARHRVAFRPNESSEQPPIVRVTIGRIDVRATTPAAPPRKSSTRSEPKLTLDSYLKSRREGTR